MKKDLIKYSILSNEDLDIITDLLTKSFEKDIWINHLLNNDYQFSIAKLFYEYIAKLSIKHGIIYSTDTHDDHIAGVSVWVPPKRNITSIFKFIENGGLKIPIATIYRLKKLSDFSAKIHKECIQKPHWYLFIIGVQPHLKSQGFGTSLLQPMLKYLNRVQLPCYLETHNANNLNFYEKHGFNIVKESIIPNSNIKHYALIRKPDTI